MLFRSLMIEIISCEEVSALEFKTLKVNRLEKIRDILNGYGAPCKEAKSAEKFVMNIVKDHAEWLIDALEDYGDDQDDFDEEYGDMSILGNLEKLAREFNNISTVYTRITYPLKRPALFRFNLNLNGKTLTAGHLLWIYTWAYQMVYALEEEEDGNPGDIPGMFNRATSNGPFGIWGHCIGDLDYNGSSKVDVYNDYVICEFDCDS